jgi:hypothetical protein
MADFDAGETETTFRLTFKEYPGLEVMIREPSVGQLMEISSVQAEDGKSVTAEQIQTTFRLFADLLVSWNLSRKGKRIPATYDGVLTLGSGFVMKLIAAVGEAVGRADPTSPTGSSPGGTTRNPVEESIPMQAASPPSS